MAKCRKALAIFLAVLMFVSILPISTIADDVKTTYNIIVNYVYQDGKQAANPYTANIAEGQAFKANVNSPVVIGYEPNQKTVEINIAAVTESVTYTVTYYPAVVEYTVKHYQQNVDNDQYTLAYEEVKEGLTESAVGSELAKSYNGFTALFYDTETKIAADGSTEVEIYYDRNYYMLNLNLDGAYGAEPVYARYGASIHVETPQKPGYTFAGWNPALPKTMPVGGGTYAAQWTPNSSADYTVVFWYENADDTNYSYAGSVNLYAEPGATVTSDSYKNYAFDGRDNTHFTYNNAKAESVTVAGDGSTVLNVYYTRKNYALTFRELTCKKDYIWHNHSDNCYTERATINAKWNAKISAEFEKAPFNTTFNGRAWLCTDSSKYSYALQTLDRMPDFDATFNLYDKSSDTLKTLYYYVSKVGTTVDDKNWPTSTVDYDLLKEVKTYFNYATYDEEYHIIQGYDRFTSSVAGFDREYQKNFKNNSLQLFYIRKSYNLKFFNYGIEVTDKNETLQYEASLADKYFIPEYPVNLETNAYEFAGWYTTPDCFEGSEVDWTKMTMPASDLMLYAKWSPKTHTVTTYITNDPMDDTTQIDQWTNVSHRSTIDAPENPVNGEYEFVGWFYLEDGVEKAYNFSMAVTKDLELYAKWSSTVPVTYTIKYELEGGTTIAETTNGSALAGATKTFDAKTGAALNEGYQEGYFPKTSSHSITMNIEGGNMFTFIYVPMDKVAYTVKYLEKGTNAVLHDPKTADTTLNVITETFVTISGYAPDAYQKQLILSANAEENVLIFWYVKDEIHAPVRIVHWTENINGDGYTEYQSTTDVNGVIGEEYAAEPIEIPGFTYNSNALGNNAAGILTADGLVLNLYYTRNEYPYEFRYVDSVTGEVIEVGKTDTARYQSMVSHTAPDNLSVSDQNYKLADTALKTMTIEIEESANAVKNIINFKYNRIFTIVHIQEGRTVEKETIEYNGRHKEFNLTAVVSEGYLYGGSFSDESCTTPQTYATDENPTSFTPEAGATYYIWEVDAAYLMPKSLSCWEHNSEGKLDVMGFFVVTPIDREYYSEVGFTVNGDTVRAKQASEEYVDNDGTTKVLIKETDKPVLYQTIRILKKDGSFDEFSIENVTNPAKAGYLACASLAKETYWNDAETDITFTPYWITLDGVTVTNATRTCKYLGAGDTADHKKIGKIYESESKPTTDVESSTQVLAEPLMVYASFIGGSTVVDPVDPVDPIDPVDPVDPKDPVDPEEPDDGTITVTVNDNGSVYELALLPGDISGEIEYLGASGCLFAGWYTDEAYVEPADFTYVTEDITIYAKYVSDAYLQVQYQQKRMSLKGGKATLISAVDSYAYAETGFVINGETLAVSPRDGSRQYYDIRWLFGNGVEKKSPILTTEISAGDYSVGDTIEVTPYWITMDGTTVYGTSRTLTIARTGFKG